nr:hypothetical protein [Tanacetum cinerariifolium]
MQSKNNNRNNSTWENFVVAIEQRFGPSAEIHGELKILKPTTISEAIGMAKLVEDKLKESKFSYYQSRPLLSNLISSVPNTTTTQAPNPPIFSKPPTTNYRIRHLSHAEQQDRRSSHNIVQPRIAKFLHLPVLVASKYFVLVGNGSSLQRMGLTDIFLGIEWLSTSGTIVADFSIPMMQFIHGSGWITLIGTDTSYMLLWIRRIGLHWIRRIELVSFVVFGECRHGYVVYAFMDTAYWSSK